MNDRIGIGYVVYCPERDTFLGKLGAWYSDIRLAGVFAEPSKAKMALNRADTAAPCVVVQVKLTVEERHIKYAVEALEKASKREEVPADKPAPPTAPKATAGPAPKGK